MLATAELLTEAAQPGRVVDELARCAREVALYQNRIPDLVDFTRLANWPFITKSNIRQGFPQNFLGPEKSMDELLEQELIELEHTSGTSEERTPLLLPKGWW